VVQKLDDSALTTALRLAFRRSESLPAEDRYVWDIESASTPLCELLEALDKIGDRLAVERLSERLMLAAAHVEPSEDFEARELGEIVRALVRAGQVDRAEQIAAAVPRPWTQGEVYNSMADAFASTGDFVRAEGAVHAIPEAIGERRSTAWIDLVSSLMRAGDQVQALRTAQLAWESILVCTETEIQPRLVNYLVEMLRQGSHWPVTRPIVVPAAEAPGGPVSTLFSLLLTGQHDQAADLIPHIADPSSREGVLIGLAATEDLHESLRLVNGITDPRSRSTAQEHLAGRMAAAGELEQARLIVAAIEMPSSRADALIVLADIVAATGDRDGARVVLQDAERAAATIVEPGARKSTWEWLVQVLAELGDFEEAEHLALALAVAGECNPVLTLGSLGREMAKAGDVAGARRVTRLAEPFAAAASDPVARASDLNWLAQVMVAAQARDDAVRLLLDAVPVEPWYLTVVSVAAVDPDAVRAVAEDLLNQNLPNRI
jgi:hypothetical protein